MTRSIIFLTFLFTLLGTQAGLSQVLPAPTPLAQKDYLKKSKVQKSIAWVLLVGGAASVIGGAAMDRGAFVEAGGWFNTPDRYENTEKKNRLKTIGIFSMCGGIPLFIAGAKNRAKGLSVSFRNLDSYRSRQQQLVRVPVPALQVTLGL